MALFDISLPPTIAKALHLPGKSPDRQQLKVLRKLLNKARFTEFGQAFHFDEILLSDDPYAEYRKRVPLFDYNKIYKDWWHKTLEGIPDVCWPGKIKFFALS